MATTVQVTPDGKVLITSGDEGLIARECCCEAGCPDNDPGFNVTVSWTGTPPELVGGNYPWLGEVWTNGETKFICPDTYFCRTRQRTNTQTSFDGPPFYFCRRLVLHKYWTYRNAWGKIGTVGLENLYMRAYYKQSFSTVYTGTHAPGNTTTCNFTSTFLDGCRPGGNSSNWSRFVLVRPRVFGQRWTAYRLKRGGNFPLEFCYVTTTSTTSNLISTFNLNPSTWNISPGPLKLNNQTFGQITTTSGVTIKWELPSGTTFCTNPPPTTFP